MVLRGVCNDKAILTFVYPFNCKRLARFQFVPMTKLCRNHYLTPG